MWGGELNYKKKMFYYYFIISMADKKTQKSKLRIKLKSYDIKMLESSVAKVVGLLIKSGAAIKGPIPLPKQRKVYTVLKSNFKFKNSREQFERITYSRMVDVVETGSKTMEYLQNLAIPVGVMVDVKVF